MAGNVKTNSVQLGDSATATQNFVLQTNVDGTAKLSRGNVGGTTQDILTVDALGGIKMPQNVVAFRANLTGSQTIPNNSITAVAFNNLITNVGGGAYNTIGGQWTPGVAGWYSINGTVAYPVSTGTGDVRLTINGIDIPIANSIPIGDISNYISVSGIVYLSATDYVQIRTSQVTGAALAMATAGNFSGILIARA